MVRTIVAVTGGVALGLVIAFANAGAFPFWSDSSLAGGEHVARRAHGSRAGARLANAAAAGARQCSGAQ